MKSDSRDAPSVWEALSKVIDAGQRLVADRIDLARLELREEARRIGTGVVILLVALLLLLAAWLLLMVTFGLLLERLASLDLAVSLGLFALVNSALGYVIIRKGIATLSPPRSGATPQGPSSTPPDSLELSQGT